MNISIMQIIISFSFFMNNKMIYTVKSKIISIQLFYYITHKMVASFYLKEYNSSLKNKNSIDILKTFSYLFRLFLKGLYSWGFFLVPPSKIYLLINDTAHTIALYSTVKCTGVYHVTFISRYMC